MSDICFSNTINTNAITRYKTSNTKLNGMFGSKDEGIAFPSVFMLYGNPGSGKTTLLNQLCFDLQGKGLPSLACIGEMKLELTAMMCNRLNINIPITDNTDIDFLCDVAIKKYKFVFIDSLQTITYDKTKYKFGKQEFIEYAINRIYDAAYKYRTCVGVIVHSTKNGSYKGSSFLPHIVDTQIKLTRDNYNIVKTETIKNRYGDTNEYCFKLTSNGYDLRERFLERIFS